MGRKCGWLALKAAVACGADWVFIPENPSPKNWKDELIHELSRTKQPEKRCSLIIIAEGAQDVDMKPISASDVCNALTEAGSDTRVTILGHVQRGGPPSFYDRASVSIYSTFNMIRISINNYKIIEYFIRICSS